MTMPALLSVLLTEPPALDLVNTHIYLTDSGAWTDVLDDREQRDAWLGALAPRLGLGADDATFTDDAADALKAVRGLAAAAVEPARHGRRPPARALSGLNEAVRAAPATVHARWDGSAVTAEARRAGSLATRLAATFAEETVRLLATPDILDVRRCDAPACVMLFLPRNPRRRWCTPNICGNRARVARYYLRHKPGRAVEPAEPVEPVEPPPA
ncbi:CGNR zinc finger domain-containing protein [Isoptericola cucumis]|uniref:CGNR zinc finger domain-containing protein n=1 Tax=Isoptericola cucumis TaxID=1776856 RepID=UPI0032081855